MKTINLLSLQKKNMKFKTIILILSVFTCHYSCSNDYTNEIEDYISKKGLTNVQSTEDGLYYIIEVPGGDEKPAIDDNVVVNYSGALTDDKKFDSGLNKTFNLTAVIAGWTRGMRLFGKGGKGKLIIPPSLGYGDNQVGSIPKNSILVFDIELLDFYK
jgi:FKBP-type peptidyl-prolyl cis-trans isomerase